MSSTFTAVLDVSNAYDIVNIYIYNKNKIINKLVDGNIP